MFQTPRKENIGPVVERKCELSKTTKKKNNLIKQAHTKLPCII